MHEGHRQRIYCKLCSGEPLQEHEKLEILLFNAYPRRNTNPVAHALLHAFGSMRGVLEADFGELKEVDGVGEEVARYIKCVGACARLAFKNDGIDVYLKNYGDFREYSVMRMRGKRAEALELYLLEKDGRVKYIYSHTDIDEHKILPDRDEIARTVAAEKPFGMVIAHNHIFGGSRPSADDDEFTEQMQVLCAINGITLYDHCIYAADNDVYSYFGTGRIDEIKRRYSLSAILKRGGV